MSRWLSPIPIAARTALAMTLPISLLVGQMSGRTEGGASHRRHVFFDALAATSKTRPFSKSPPRRLSQARHRAGRDR
ncbi:MAG: hypothetical protein E5X49_27535 [Mesorhizobium sp.]|nr:MAG: hypothetical protein EOQ28_02860 [Mesorhizobium sp.]RWC05100.1 MAG: hypothetical protein EOQ57_05810 [Mesorhizobium sp.]RWG82520.1 MAG: hypothetical protein EOQ69_15475 [Mesorhizobium sp.]RWG83668.1 MAG: hypothetical protein EOQ70_20590 [Mesorhizobium sp.]RWK09850.1 MAG: hypothetical protein EOR39_16935 [Mesorhizobium sp.]